MSKWIYRQLDRRIPGGTVGELFQAVGAVVAFGIMFLLVAGVAIAACGGAFLPHYE